MEAIAGEAVRNTELFMKIYHEYSLPPASKLTTEFKLAYLSNVIGKIKKTVELTQLIESVKVTHISSATSLHLLLMSYIARGSITGRMFGKKAIGLKPQADRYYYLTWLETTTSGLINAVIKPVQDVLVLIGKNANSVENIVLPTDTTDLLKGYISATKYKPDTSKGGLATVKRADKRDIKAVEVIKYIIQPMSSKSKQTIALLMMESAALPGLPTGLTKSTDMRGDTNDANLLQKQWTQDTARLLIEFDAFSPNIITEIIVR
jgi:hypothetical protein